MKFGLNFDETKRSFMLVLVIKTKITCLGNCFIFKQL